MEDKTLYHLLLGIRKQYLWTTLTIAVLFITVITLQNLEYFNERRLSVSYMCIPEPKSVNHMGVRPVRQSVGNDDDRLIHNGKKNDSFKYHGINLMDLPTYKFDSKYKNPCWREAGTQRLRCLPYFFLIGVMKCGSTVLWNYIKHHPDFALPDFYKESQWFAKERFKPGYGDFNKFIKLFQSSANRIEKENGAELITGEASPSNLYNNSHWRYLPGNENLQEPRYVILDYIHHFLPRAKIIIIFRDPVERMHREGVSLKTISRGFIPDKFDELSKPLPDNIRETIAFGGSYGSNVETFLLYSEYNHRFPAKRGRPGTNPSPEKFHALVVRGVKLYNECLKTRTIRACVYDERIYEPLNIAMQLGFYHVFWEELTRLFPREQMLPLQNKELADVNAIMDKVFMFLGMRPVQELERFNRTLSHLSKKCFNVRYEKNLALGDMLNETRRILVEFYRPHNERMYQIMKDDAFLYH